MQKSSEEKTKIIRILQPQPLADKASRIELIKTHTIYKNKWTVKFFFKKRLALRSARFKFFICRRSMHKTSSQKWHPYHVQDFNRRTLNTFHQHRSRFFGPFFIQNRKKTEKHYDIIFNCLITRAALFGVLPRFEY